MDGEDVQIRTFPFDGVDSAWARPLPVPNPLPFTQGDVAGPRQKGNDRMPDPTTILSGPPGMRPAEPIGRAMA